MKKSIVLAFCLFAALTLSYAQCIPDSTVKSTGFKVSDTCAISGQSFSSIITIFIPDSISISPTTKISIDSIVIKSIAFGTGTGLKVVYKDGNKKVIANVPYCALIKADTVTGPPGIYSTAATGKYQITFAADAYKNGAVIFQISEAFLQQFGLEIKFRIVANAAECANPSSSLSQMFIDGLNNLQISPNPMQSKGNFSFESTKESHFQYRISDLVGNTVFTDNIISEYGKNKVELNTNRFSNGIYFLHVTDGLHVITRKFIVQ